MLQRLNWLGSEKRKAWWLANPPDYIYVHSERMGFKKHLTELPAKERNATDSIEYAHFVFVGRTALAPRPKFSQLRII